MGEERRVAVVFEVEGASFETRERVRGIHRWAEEHGGRWRMVHDPFAADRVDAYDGAVGTASKPLMRAAREAGVPLVIATSRLAKMAGQTVVENRWLGGAMAGRHLIERFYTHFAFVGIGHDMASTTLEHGFIRALRGRGFGFVVERHAWVKRRRKVARVRFRENMGRLLDELERPAGIVAARDSIALMLAELCAEKGIRVPEEVGIVGAGNDPAVCLGAPVPLTSVEFDLEQVGYRAAALLEHLMAGGPPRIGNVLVHPTLVARASTGRAFYSDTAVAEALDYITRQCHRPLRVADVAKAAGVSERTLLRRFQRVRRRTVAQEIARARLRHAEDLLQHTDLSIEAVARAVGFATGRHLSAVFRSHHATTPTAWRAGRPRQPMVDADELARAKFLLERTRLPVPTVAFSCGFPDVRFFREAFYRRERKLPGAYRRHYWAEHPHATDPKPGKPREVNIFIHYDDRPRETHAPGTTDERT